MAKSDDSRKQKRYTRREPEREGPHRKAQDYVRRNASSQNGHENGFTNSKGAVSEAVQQAISHVVHVSSSVIEEQIRAGQAAAARMREDLSKSDVLNHDIKAVAENLVATTKEVGNAWVDLLTIITKAIGEKPSHPPPNGGGCPPPQGGGYPPGHGASHSPPRGSTAEPRTRISRASSGGATTNSYLTPADPEARGEPADIAVTGYGVKEVTLDLRPPSTRFVPLVLPLFAGDPRHSLDGIKFGLDEQRKLVLTVNGPRGLPAGVYTGAIVDSTTKQHGGTVSVTVSG